MLRNIDRYASSECRRIKIGDRARFPVVLRGDYDVYRHTWTVVAFPVRGANDHPAYCRGLAHCVVVRRLADGLEKTIAQHLFARYALEDEPVTITPARREHPRYAAADRRIAAGVSFDEYRRIQNGAGALVA